MENERRNKNSISKEKLTLLGLMLAIALGGYVRAIHALSSDFPLNDGGLFYVMIRDIQFSGYALPAFTTYNGTQIPFAYPPLSFYFSAILSDIFNWRTISIIKILPSLISIATIPAFYRLSRKILQSEKQIIFATFAFALMPTAFDWQIVGGGLSRSLGYFFAIFTIYHVHSLYTSNSKWHVVTTAIFASLTILSHPGTAWFAFYSALVLFVFYGLKDERWLFKSAAVIILIIGITAPWWVTISSNHGFSVFVYPYQTESPTLAAIFIPLTLLFTNEPFLQIMAFLGLLGFLVSIKDRRFFIPVWLMAVFVFESRLSANYSVIPMALLGGYGLDQAILPIFTSSPKLGKITFGYFLIYALIAAYLSPNYRTVTPDQYDTMQWVSSNTPETSQFLVVSGIPLYGIDHIAEWFPAISHRSSLTTPQGHEWLPDLEFTRRDEIHKSLQDCVDEEGYCIQSWAMENEISFTHIYLPKFPKDDNLVSPNDLVISLNDSSDFEMIYDSPGGVVFTHK